MAVPVSLHQGFYGFFLKVKIFHSCQIQLKYLLEGNLVPNFILEVCEYKIN